MFAGINDQLRRDAARFKRLIHLFATDDRNVEISLAANIQRWRSDRAGLEKRRRNAQPRFGILPRRAKLLFITKYILIRAVKRNLISCSGAAYGRSESVIARDDVVGE